MSFIKKITSFLFEETDPDIIAEDDLEEVTIKEPKETIQQRVVQEPKQTAMPIHEEPVEEVKQEPKKFVSIDLEDEAIPIKPVKDVRKLTTTSSMNVKKEEKKEYEFTPVISPIFGAKEEVQKKKVKTQSVSIPHTRKKKENPLGTIISPYYGMNELEEFEEEAKKDIEEKEKIRSEESIARDSSVELQENDLREELIQEIAEEEEHTLPLEDILADDEIDEDDMMQISLFGESTPIKEAAALSDDTLDE